MLSKSDPDAIQSFVSDASYLPGGFASRVVFPDNASEVAEVLASATQDGTPVTVSGAGTGTVAFGFKGGIGTASRKLPPRLGGFTVGVLVQTNFGGVLTINGAPVGRYRGYGASTGTKRRPGRRLVDQRPVAPGRRGHRGISP